MAKKRTAGPMSDEILSHLRDLLFNDPDKIVAKWKQPHTGAQRVALSMFNKLESGDIQTFEKICDRAEGKPQQAIETTNKNMEVVVYYEGETKDKRTCTGIPEKTSC